MKYGSSLGYLISNTLLLQRPFMVESSYSDDMLEQIVDGKELFLNFITHAPTMK